MAVRGKPARVKPGLAVFALACLDSLLLQAQLSTADHLADPGSWPHRTVRNAANMPARQPAHLAMRRRSRLSRQLRWLVLLSPPMPPVSCTTIPG